MNKKEAAKVQVGTKVVYSGEKVGTIEAKRLVASVLGYPVDAYVFDVVCEDGTKATGIPYAFLKIEGRKNV